MTDERVEVAAGELARWVVVALVILTGVGLYVRLAPHTPAIAAPVAREVAA